MSTKTELTAIGLMSGTSLDGIDVALLRTDGVTVEHLGPTFFEPYTPPQTMRLRTLLEMAQQEGRNLMGSPVVSAVEQDFTRAHARAVQALLEQEALKPSAIDVVGFHGQTILHRPAERWTWQIGDGGLLARELGITVVNDFRSADVAAGGQGAPLAPIYHAALVRHSGIDRTVAVLNLGGVGNVTLVTSDEADLLAFDTGPANGMIDQLVQDRTGQRYDRDGILARSGKVDEEVLALLLSHPYFLTAGPKSLDRYEFSLNSVRNLSLEEACATLTAFAAQAVAYGVESLPVKPHWLIACGGGRHNPVLMREIGARAGVPLAMAEEMNWRGDSIEAEAFAYLAARCHEGLPISFPGTTGVASAMTGGVIVEP